MKALLIGSVLVFSAAFTATTAFAECSVVKGGAKSAFDGKSLDGMKVEKKSLAALNSAHKGLNVTQGVFTGKVTTCDDCSKDDHITCN